MRRPSRPAAVLAATIFVATMLLAAAAPLFAAGATDPQSGLETGLPAQAEPVSALRPAQAPPPASTPTPVPDASLPAPATPVPNASPNAAPTGPDLPDLRWRQQPPIPFVSMAVPTAGSVPPAASPSAGSAACGADAALGAAEDDYDLPMPWGEASFEAYRKGYLSDGGRKWLQAMVERGRPWMSFIMERIYAYGLPEELAWLPIIESEFTPNAVSKSGAVGLWQFMRNSVGGYGIRIDDWVDERRDFMKATDAALRKLADNYDTLGDWNLALAAYNMGLGAISRAVAAGGTKDFFALRDSGRLSRETSAYVPKFLAVASILRHPARFGMSLAWDGPVEWETVELGRSVDLGLLASAAGLPVERLRAANAELRYTVTPPWLGYRLKVPAGASQPVEAALSDPAKKLLRYTLRTVRSGDSVSAISRDYGTPIQMIVDANPGLQPSHIRIGQILVIPMLKDGAPPPPPVPIDDAPPFAGTYTVVKGDSLWSLALRFDVRPETLAERNGLELSSVLREGMSLSVPITKP